MVRKHACIDGPEIDAHIIDWDKFLPRFNQFKAQEARSLVQYKAANGEGQDGEQPKSAPQAAVSAKPG